MRIALDFGEYVALRRKPSATADHAFHQAAFISSVTYELRTPLTTFRMYAEMLAKGMAPDTARRR